MEDVLHVRDRLLREDAQFRRLVEKHLEYEQRLEQLQAQRWLSDDERLEEVKIKKLKLALKDQMENMLRRASQ
jgi:hypothetical protein